MDMMHYIRGEIRKDEGTARMDTMPDITIGQLLSLPNGTEVLAVTIGPFGVGLHLQGFLIDDKFREGVMDPAQHVDCNHSMERADVEASNFPGSLFVVLMPEGYEPDPSELINEKFIRRGVRDGNDGMPPSLPDALRIRYPDEWHDGAYAAYMAAYKSATERKKGR